MSPEFTLEVKVHLPSETAARKLKSAIRQFNGVVAVEISTPLQQDEKQEIDEGMNLIKLGEILRQKRIEIGIQQSSLARRIGISRTSVWITEAGKNPRTGKPIRTPLDRLDKWMAILKLEENERNTVLTLAGFKHHIDDENEI